MIVAVSVFEIHLPSCRSLKGKRRVIKPLVERIHRMFRVSIAETDYHDLHQRAEFGLALVSRSYSEAQGVMEEIRSVIEELPDLMLIAWSPEYLEELS